MTGAASSAVRAVVRAAPHALQVAAVFPAAVYLADPATGRIVMTVVARDGIAHPNAVVLGRPTAAGPFATVRDHDPVLVGDHRLVGAWGVVRVTRWWSPRPAVAPVTPASLAAAIAAAARIVGQRAPELPADEARRFDALLAAVAADRPDVAVAAVDRLLGVGAGLTPTGDDLLAGSLAALHVLGPAITPTSDERALPAPVGDTPSARVVAAVTARIRQRADHATTAISAALLRHAIQGQVCAPAAGLLRAMAAASPALERPLTDLLRVGATSGRDLTLGILAGARLLAATPEATGPGIPTALTVPVTATSGRT